VPLGHRFTSWLSILFHWSICLFLNLFYIWPLRDTLSWLLCSSDFLYFFQHFLFIWYKMFQSHIFYASVWKLDICLSNLILFTWKWNLENQLWTIDVLIGTSISLLLGSLRHKDYIYTYICIYIYVCVYIYMYINMYTHGETVSPIEHVYTQLSLSIYLLNT
jgi:hypothetical protein